MFETHEVLDVAFNEELDSSLFIYTPALGEQVNPAVPFVEHLSLESAVARMPFAVLVPTTVPDQDHTQLEVMYHPARLRLARSHLTLMYRNHESDASLWIDESHTPEPELEKFEWERLEAGSQEMLISDPGAGVRVIVTTLHGTHITIWSDIERDRLVELAKSLAPARLPSTQA